MFHPKIYFSNEFQTMIPHRKKALDGRVEIVHRTQPTRQNMQRERNSPDHVDCHKIFTFFGRDSAICSTSIPSAMVNPKMLYLFFSLCKMWVTNKRLIDSLLFSLSSCSFYVDLVFSKTALNSTNAARELKENFFKVRNDIEMCAEGKML